MGALTGSPRPLSAYDLLDRLRPTGVAAPLTVYRALEKLVASGSLHRIESLNAFIACRGGEHHHGRADAPAPPRAVGFTICDVCGAVEEFVDPKLFDQLHQKSVETRPAPRHSAIEVHGVCAICAVSRRGVAQPASVAG